MEQSFLQYQPERSFGALLFVAGRIFNWRLTVKGFTTVANGVACIKDTVAGKWNSGSGGLAMSAISISPGNMNRRRTPMA